ncbi:hypothetical protein [Nostoc sp.]
MYAPPNEDDEELDLDGLDSSPIRTVELTPAGIDRLRKEVTKWSILTVCSIGDIRW